MGHGTGRAFVLGGGVAGLSATFGLCDRGYRVTLCESRGWLGGRAFSFEDRVTGQRLDNGPHVMLGCYRDMRALLRRIGSEQHFAHSPALTVAYRDQAGRRATLRLSRLPVPLSMPFALWSLPVTRRERLRAVFGLASVLRGAPAHWTLADWLSRRRQTGAPADWLWVPLCRAIMNVEPEQASAQLFLRALREAFTGRARSGAFMIPTSPWGQSVGEAAVRQLAEEAVDLRTGARVTRFSIAGDRIVRLHLTHGDSLDVDADDLVVSALPWHALQRLLGENGRASASRIAAIDKSPIVSVYFECERDEDAIADDGPITALVSGAPFHFVCRTPGAPRRRFALLAGGARSFDGATVAAIERRAREQLARTYDGFDARVAARVRVAKEAAATIVPAPGTRRLRPAPGPVEGGPRNLLVCGDWTDCGLPSTLEGAARSARLLMERMRGLAMGSGG